MMENNIFKKLRNITHVNERQWNATLDMKYVPEVSEHPTEKELTELKSKLKSTIANFIAVQKDNLDMSVLDELAGLKDDLDVVNNDVDEIDTWLTGLYDWADGYSVWVKTIG